MIEGSAGDEDTAIARRAHNAITDGSNDKGQPPHWCVDPPRPRPLHQHFIICSVVTCLVKPVWIFRVTLAAAVCRLKLPLKLSMLGSPGDSDSPLAAGRNQPTKETMPSDLCEEEEEEEEEEEGVGAAPAHAVTAVEWERCDLAEGRSSCNGNGMPSPTALVTPAQPSAEATATAKAAGASAEEQPVTARTVASPENTAAAPTRTKPALSDPCSRL
jgi:hypothetical protein